MLVFHCLCFSKLLKNGEEKEAMRSGNVIASPVGIDSPYLSMSHGNLGFGSVQTDSLSSCYFHSEGSDRPLVFAFIGSLVLR